MRRILSGVLAITLLVSMPVAASAANPPAPTNLTPFTGPSVTVGSQAWWDKAGIVIPTRVGQHIHVDTKIPTFAVTASTLVLPVTINQHNGTGPITWVRACRESSNCQTWSVNIGPCADCSTYVTLPINIGAWPAGKQELRLTANVASNDEGNRQFQSTGWPIQHGSSTSCPRCSVFWTARSWYTDRGYQNAELESDPAQLGPGKVFKYYGHPGTDTIVLPTKRTFVTLDPHMHIGDPGRVLVDVSGSARGSYTMPSLTSGQHVLAIGAGDGNNMVFETFTFQVP